MKVKSQKKLSKAERKIEYDRLLQQTKRMFDDLGLGQVTTFKHLLKSAEVRTGKQTPSAKDIANLRKIERRSEMLKHAKVSLVYTRAKNREEMEIRALKREMLNQEIERAKKEEKQKETRNKELRKAVTTIQSFIHSLEAVLNQIEQHRDEKGHLNKRLQNAKNGGNGLIFDLEDWLNGGTDEEIIYLADRVTEFTTQYQTIDINSLYDEASDGTITNALFGKYEKKFENDVADFW